MALNLLGITPQPLQIGKGMGSNALIIADCTPLTKPPAQITIPIVWANYGADSSRPVLISIDLSTYGPGLPIDSVRSCYIDNSNSPTTVYAIFDDTQFVVQCAPYSIVLAPCWTNGYKVKLFATGFTDLNIPTTTFEFSNSHVNSYYQASSPVLPKVKSIVRVAHYAIYAPVSGVNTVPVSLGTPAPSRRTVVTTRGMAASALNLVSFANANPGTILAQVSSTAGFCNVAMCIPTYDEVSSTGNIRVSYSITPAIIALDVFALYNLEGSGVPYDVKSSTNTAMSITSPANGVALYGQALADPLNLLPLRFALGINGAGLSFSDGISNQNLSSGNAISSTTGLLMAINNYYSGANQGQVVATFQ